MDMIVAVFHWGFHCFSYFAIDTPTKKTMFIFICHGSFILCHSLQRIAINEDILIWNLKAHIILINKPIRCFCWQNKDALDSYQSKFYGKSEILNDVPVNSNCARMPKTIAKESQFKMKLGASDCTGEDFKCKWY